MEMGFPEDVCAEALERYDGDENLALNFLLGGWKFIISWKLLRRLLSEGYFIA